MCLGRAGYGSSKPRKHQTSVENEAVVGVVGRGSISESETVSKFIVRVACGVRMTAALTAYLEANFIATATVTMRWPR